MTYCAVQYVHANVILYMAYVILQYYSLCNEHTLRSSDVRLRHVSYAGHYKCYIT